MCCLVLNNIGELVKETTKQQKNELKDMNAEMNYRHFVQHVYVPERSTQNVNNRKKRDLFSSDFRAYA